MVERMRQLDGRKGTLRLVSLVAGMIAMAVLALALLPAAGGDPQLALEQVRLVTAGSSENAKVANGPALVGISPVMGPRDYADRTAFRAKIAGYLKAARQAGLMPKGSIVVWPEHIGTWLVAMDAPGIVTRAPGMGLAMAALAVARPRALWQALGRSEEAGRLAAALFRSRGEAMAAAYQDVFGDLARRFGVVIVAGSIVLENPAVVDGRLMTRPGPLYNASVVFHADGRPDPALVRKIYPIPSEQPFTAAADVVDLPVFETPAGRLGVLICADSWYPQTFTRLAEQDVEIVAVPSFLQPDGVWNAPWKGYVTRRPADVDPADAGRLTEGEAWRKYGLAGRLARSGARAGINVFLKGDLWGLGSDGRTTAVWPGGHFISDVERGAEILALPLRGERKSLP